MKDFSSRLCVHLQNSLGKGVESTDWGKAEKISYSWRTNIVSVRFFEIYFQANQDLIRRQLNHTFYCTFKSVWFQKFTLIWLCFLLCSSRQKFLQCSCGNMRLFLIATVIGTNSIYIFKLGEFT